MSDKAARRFILNFQPSGIAWAGSYEKLACSSASPLRMFDRI